MDESQVGCHPLKSLRRQTLEEMDEAMASGKPAASVVNMRAAKSNTQEAAPGSQEESKKAKEIVYEPLFSGVKERDVT